MARAWGVIDRGGASNLLASPRLDVFLIFRRAIPGERSGIVGKLDDDVAGAAIAFRSFELAVPDSVPKFFEDRGIGRCVRLEARLVFTSTRPIEYPLATSSLPFFDYGSLTLVG